MDDTPISGVLRRTARIVESNSGGPIRFIITGRRTVPTGRWHSNKTGRSQPWEARAERDHFFVCDADTDVASYMAQPHRLEIDVGTKNPLIYLPDVTITRADGSVEVVEIKRACEVLKKEYLEKLGLAEEVYAGLGWGFRILTDVEIRREPRFRNARRICAHQPAVVTTQQTLDVLAHIGEHGFGTMGDLARLLGDGADGWACLHALVVQRLLHVDLDTPPRRWADAAVSLVDSSRNARRSSR
ncbi:TnsA endonuclease N-terminal domain-containing protein [Methylosinus sporium]|uniref:TnsA endonuclease N-terminal domain-containing protein n=1 Tax=Methylosinus sporium TaxID=428 RepID=UPI00383BAD26